MPSYAVVIAEERLYGISCLSFIISLSRPALVLNSNAVLPICSVSGNAKVSDGLRTYLLSRDHLNLKAEFQNGNGKITVDSVQNIPAVDLVLGEHVFLTAGDLYSATKSRKF